MTGRFNMMEKRGKQSGDTLNCIKYAETLLPIAEHFFLFK
jgi:hypothetical protein